MMAGADFDRDVRDARAGDRQAFARLVARHARMVTAVALARVRDPEVALEVAQEAFLDAWRTLPRLRDDARFAGWLRRIAENRAASIARLAGSRAGRESVYSFASIADAAPDALAALGAEEDRRRIAATLEALPEDTRAAAVLHWRDGASIAEIAESLELREDAVRKRLSRARERVRTEMLGSFALAPFVAVVAGALRPRPAQAAGISAGFAAALAGIALLGGVVAVASVPRGTEDFGEIDRASVSRGTQRLAAADVAPESQAGDVGARATGTGAVPRGTGSASVPPSGTARSSHGEIAGIVLEGGRPAAGVSVSAICFEPGDLGGKAKFYGYGKRQAPTAITGADGAFRLIDDRLHGHCWVQAQDPVRGFASESVQGGASGVRLTLGLAGVIRGSFRHADGTIATEIRGAIGAQGAGSTSILDGTFELKHVEPGRYRLWTLLDNAPDPDPAEAEIVDPGEIITLHFTLPERGTRVVGRALERSGEPIAGVPLIVEGERSMRNAGRTGPDGRFVIDDMRGERTLLIKWGGPLKEIDLGRIGDDPIRDLGDIVRE